MNDYIFVILSSSSDNIYDPMLTMFYSEKSIDPKEISDKVNLMDISKTVLSYSKLKIPYYFSGMNLVAKQGFEERKDILGSDLDTLMFYNDDILFKKQKYSNSYETIHLSDKDINTIYKTSPKPKPQGLLLHYSFDNDKTRAFSEFF